VGRDGCGGADTGGGEGVAMRTQLLGRERCASSVESRQGQGGPQSSGAGKPMAALVGIADKG
jgi:hypothetical protein